MGRGELGTPCDCLVLAGPATMTQESCLQLRPHFLVSNSLSGHTCQNPKSLLGLFEF